MIPESDWTYLNMPEYAGYGLKRGKKIGGSRFKKNQT